MLALIAATALAHPVGERFATQTTILEIHRDHVRIDYLADVPQALLRSGARGPEADPVAAMATELTSGLLLQVDGAVVPLTRWGDPVAPLPSSEHTWTFEMHFEAPLLPTTSTVRLSTANLQDASNYYAGDIRIADGLVVTSSSLLQLQDGRISRDDTLRWRQDDEARVLEVTLGPPPPPWWQVLAPHGPRHVGAALAPSPRDLLRPTVLTPALWLGLLALAATLGAAAGRAGARSTLIVPLGLLATLVPPSTPLLGGAAIALVVLGSVATRRRELLPWLAMGAVAALVASTPSPRAALGVAVAGVILRPVRGSGSPAAWPLAALTAIWLGLRAS